ncbi:MAG: flavodoxin-dependent (E)-4-hydroxy-3-methylbut-2-enyl-diphosphate synthase [Proteobacteria bacterium]|nr:flavodoxin-dependent (E)-4-hydroxy-3-methylbut-2-enyl-diphosphate synthase [Pseudomonadota bacterium]
MDTLDFVKPRRKTRQIRVGNVLVGGGAPISVQSMTNTPTEDVAATVGQILKLSDAGADIVRVSCPTVEATDALKDIVSQSPVPIVADIHFHYQRGIEAAKAGAACLRINPGNIGNQSRVREVVKAARDHGCSMRIGVNAGSLEKHLLEKYKEPCPEAMVESALFHAAFLQEEDFHDFKISVKASNVAMAVTAYRMLSEKLDYPLHLGITESGPLRLGLVRSAIGLGMMLQEGIGDTIRVSLAADPVEEIHAGFNILKSLNLRHRGVNIVACPSCARQGFDVVKTVALLEEKLAHITEPMTVSIIGCVVNGPGEALKSDIGLTGGGNGTHMVYMAGKRDHQTSTQDMVSHIVDLVEQAQANRLKVRIQPENA